MSWLACICQVFTMTSSPWIRGFDRFALEWTLIGSRSEILGPSASPPFPSPTSDEWTFEDSECSGGWFRMSWTDLEQWIQCTASPRNNGMVIEACFCNSSRLVQMRDDPESSGQAAIHQNVLDSLRQLTDCSVSSWDNWLESLWTPGRFGVLGTVQCIYCYRKEYGEIILRVLRAMSSLS